MFYDYITKYTEILVDKMREAFAMQKLLTFFQKYWHISGTSVLNFNETLTNDVVSFEQLGPGKQIGSHINCFPLKPWREKMEVFPYTYKRFQCFILYMLLSKQIYNQTNKHTHNNCFDAKFFIYRT